jgi:protein phosphatase
MSFLLASAARATTGARAGQEDAFRLWPAEGVAKPKGEEGGLLAVLADGMGGHTGGAIAGQTACKTFTEVFAAANSSFEARLKTALHASNEALAKGVEQNAALKGMGCTIVAAWIDDLGIRWTSVGDSLLLLYRLPDVIRLNADHSLGSFLDEQARQNKITRSEARRNRNRNALRSALTGSKIDLIDLRGEPLELRPGDWVLLASDGTSHDLSRRRVFSASCWCKGATWSSLRWMMAMLAESTAWSARSSISETFHSPSPSSEETCATGSFIQTNLLICDEHFGQREPRNIA